MSGSQIAFLIISALTVYSALMVVTGRNLVRSALWLVMTLFMVAAVFTTLDAGFMAVVQIVVYIGAIAILILFAVMLTRKVMNDTEPQTNDNWWMAVIVSVVIFVGMVFMVSGVSLPARPASDVSNQIVDLGNAFVSPNQFILPFEVASVLLIAALIGGIAIAMPREEEG